MGRVVLSDALSEPGDTNGTACAAALPMPAKLCANWPKPLETPELGWVLPPVAALGCVACGGATEPPLLFAGVGGGPIGGLSGAGVVV